MREIKFPCINCSTEPEWNVFSYKLKFLQALRLLVELCQQISHVKITMIEDIVAIARLVSYIATSANLTEILTKFVHFVHVGPELVPRRHNFSECSQCVGEEQVDDYRILVDVVRISLEIVLILVREARERAHVEDGN